MVALNQLLEPGLDGQLIRRVVEAQREFFQEERRHAHRAVVGEDEILSAFLGQFYEDVPCPREIMLDRSLDEACALLAASDDARIIAGGQTLVPLMAMRLAMATTPCWHRTPTTTSS